MVKHIAKVVLGEDLYQLKDTEVRGTLDTHASNTNIHVTAAEKEYWNSKVNPPSYSAPTAKQLTYTGEAQDLLNPGSSTIGNIQYSTDETNWSTTVPQETNAGTYTVYWRFIGSELVYVDSTAINVTIAKANPTYTAPTAKSGLVYNTGVQELLNAGTTSGGTILYSEDNENWGSSVPSKTNAGDYVVYWKLDGGTNYESVAGSSFNTSIAKVTPTVVAPTAKTGLVYDGTAQELVNAGSTDFGTLQYSLDDETYGTTIPSGNNAGDYSVYYKVVGDSNINDIVVTSISVSIAKANRSASFEDANGHDYIEINGTKWATKNVGALSETSYGNYYMYGKGTTTYNSSHPIYTGAEVPLSSSLDTARQVMGGSWRMPTKSQFQELINNTTYTWTTVNGVKGGKFTASDGKYIFIPAAGVNTNQLIGEYGYLWSSSCSGRSDAIAFSIGNGFKYTAGVSRSYGLSIRGVLSTSYTSTLEIGNAETIQVFTTGTPTITLSSSNTNVAIVNDMTVIPINAGSTVITATVDWGSNYNIASISYTLTVPNTHQSYEFVDLGLPSGTLWAKYNYGDSDYNSMPTYFMYGKLTPYNKNDSVYGGTEDPLSSSVDVAAAGYGGSWHMPTKTQLEELIANTTYTWETIGNVSGGKFTATNGNYVFFPAAGYWYNGSHRSDGSQGYVWSSSPDGSSFAFYLLLGSGGDSVRSSGRNLGCSVRPVVG